MSLPTKSPPFATARYEQQDKWMPYIRLHVSVCVCVCVCLSVCVCAQFSFNCKRIQLGADKSSHELAAYWQVENDFFFLNLPFFSEEKEEEQKRLE